ncbi:MAG: L,D-transpeptidase family protein [Clostridia bacterium]
MKNKYTKILAVFLICMLTAVCWGCAQEDSVLRTIAQIQKVQEADVIFVVVQQETGTSCDFYAYRKKGDAISLAWRTEGYVGRGGVADPANRYEGDGTSPAGVYSLGECFGINAAPDNMALPYTVVDNDDYWDGDSASPTYNQHVKGSEMPDSWDASSSEHLIEYTIAYNYCAMINFNVDPVVPGKGSCIFLHCTYPASTSSSGCIAIPEEYMIKALQMMTEDSYIVIASSMEDLEAADRY